MTNIRSRILRPGNDLKGIETNPQQKLNDAELLIGNFEKAIENCTKPIVPQAPPIPLRERKSADFLSSSFFLLLFLFIEIIIKTRITKEKIQ